jgi:hypothetical protein
MYSDSLQICGSENNHISSYWLNTYGEELTQIKNIFNREACSSPGENFSIAKQE